MIRLVIVTFVVALLAASGHAQPDLGSAGSDSPKDAARAHFVVGQQQFDAGAFLQAASEFDAAFALDPDPVYLYNAAQAYRLGSACARAADYYRRFLAAVPNPPNLEKVQHYLQELDACVNAEAAEQPKEPQPIATPPQTPTPVITQAAAPQPVPEGSRPIIVPIAVASGGIALLVVGGIFTHDVHTLEGYSATLCTQGSLCDWDASKQSRADSLQSRGNRDSAIAVTAYAVGGAALIASSLLYALLPREAISVTPVAGGAMMSTRVAF